MDYFDTSQPTNLSAIDQYISRYASPEAAQTDTQLHAPGGYDYLTKQYQDLTGDAFADPFEDAAKKRDSALSNLIATSPTPISVNVGNTATGPTINPATVAMAQTSAARAGRATQDATLQDTMLNATLSHPDYQLPNSSSPDFADIQTRRAHAFGVTDIFEHLKNNNPKALLPTSDTDPELQLDAKGKPVAGDVLNSSLYTDPKFQLLLKTDPGKAKKLYSALYDRDLESDLTMQRGANTKRADVRDKTLGELAKNLIFDDITGEPQLRTYVRDPLTGDQIEGKPRPLSAIEKHFIDQEGGFEGKFGFKPPARLNLTPSETDQIKTKRDEILKVNPNVSKEVATLQARKELSAAPAAAPTTPFSPNKLVRTATFMQDFLRAAPNTVIDQANRLFAGNNVPVQIPEIPHVTGEEVSNATGDIFDWLRQQGREHVFTPSGTLALR